MPYADPIFPIIVHVLLLCMDARNSYAPQTCSNKVCGEISDVEVSDAIIFLHGYPRREELPMYDMIVIEAAHKALNGAMENSCDQYAPAFVRFILDI